MFILILIIFSLSSLPFQLFVSGSANDKMATYITGIAGGIFVPVATTDYATTSCGWLKLFIFLSFDCQHSIMYCAYLIELNPMVDMFIIFLFICLLLIII